MLRTPWELWSLPGLPTAWFLPFCVLLIVTLSTHDSRTVPTQPLNKAELKRLEPLGLRQLYYSHAQSLKEFFNHFSYQQSF